MILRVKRGSEKKNTEEGMTAASTEYKITVSFFFCRENNSCKLNSFLNK